MTERRAYTVISTVREHGRSRITLVCPWCGSHVVAYTWSLAGQGKRCPCGVLFTPRDAIKRDGTV